MKICHQAPASQIGVGQSEVNVDFPTPTDSKVGLYEAPAADKVAKSFKGRIREAFRSLPRCALKARPGPGPTSFCAPVWEGMPPSSLRKLMPCPKKVIAQTRACFVMGADADSVELLPARVCAFDV